MKREKRWNNTEGLGQRKTEKQQGKQSRRSVFIILIFKRVQWPEINFPLQLCIVQYINISLGLDNLCVCSFLWQFIPCSWHQHRFGTLTTTRLYLHNFVQWPLGTFFQEKRPCFTLMGLRGFLEPCTNPQDFLTLAFSMSEKLSLCR